MRTKISIIVKGTKPDNDISIVPDVGIRPLDKLVKVAKPKIARKAIIKNTGRTTPTPYAT